MAHAIHDEPRSLIYPFCDVGFTRNENPSDMNISTVEHNFSLVFLFVDESCYFAQLWKWLNIFPEDSKSVWLSRVIKAGKKKREHRDVSQNKFSFAPGNAPASIEAANKSSQLDNGLKINRISAYSSQLSNLRFLSLAYGNHGKTELLPEIPVALQTQRHLSANNFPRVYQRFSSYDLFLSSNYNTL